MRFVPMAALAALASASPLSAQTAVAPQFAAPLAGSWSFTTVAGGSDALFTDSAGRMQLALHCARSVRRVTIAKPATAAAPFMVVWTSSLSRSVPASFDPTTNRISVNLPAFDGLLDAMAYSRGRIGVTVSGTSPLIVPAWPEVARLVEDCRS
jgi:hypothetical protein